MEYFILVGDNNVRYVVCEDLSITRDDGFDIKLSSKGSIGGFQQYYVLNGKKIHKYHQVGKMYAEHFIPNPEGYKYARIKDRDKPVSRENIIWSPIRSRRAASDVFRKKTEAQKSKEIRMKEERLKTKIAMDKMKNLSVQRDGAMDENPLSKFFLKKEDCHSFDVKKPTPKFDHNFKLIVK